MHPHFRERFDVVADVLELVGRTFREPVIELSRLLMGPVFRAVQERASAPDFETHWKRLCEIDHRPRVREAPGEDGFVEITQADADAIVGAIIWRFRDEVYDLATEFDFEPVTMGLITPSEKWCAGAFNLFRRIAARQRVASRRTVAIVEEPNLKAPAAPQHTPRGKRSQRSKEEVEALLGAWLDKIEDEFGLRGFSAEMVRARSGLPLSTIKGHRLFTERMERRMRKFGSTRPTRARKGRNVQLSIDPKARDAPATHFSNYDPREDMDEFSDE